MDMYKTINDIIKLITCAEEGCGTVNIHHTWKTIFTSNDSTYSNPLISVAMQCKKQCKKRDVHASEKF